MDELLPLVLVNGVGTLILGSDDPGELRRFAEEVIPAVREAVARERASGGVATDAVRSSAALAKRRDNIDYDGLPDSLVGSTVEPGDFGYGRVRSTYMRGGSPGLVIQPNDVAELVDALAFARDQDVPLAVRSGGHGISGRSTNDGGIVLDLGKLNTIEVLDEERRLVRIGAGARWKDVAAALAPHGWALSSGDYGGVGVGGLATAGGIGWLVREHGLTIDHMRAAALVLADGSQVYCSETENQDLFWGVRGAGANFGIATSFDFEVDEVGDVGFGQFVLDASDPAGFLHRWGAAMEAAPRDLTTNLIMAPPRRGQMLAQIYGVVDSDVPETIIDRFEKVVAAGPLLDQSVQLVPYAGVMNVPDAAARRPGRSGGPVRSDRAHHAGIRSRRRGVDPLRRHLFLPDPLGGRRGGRRPGRRDRLRASLGELLGGRFRRLEGPARCRVGGSWRRTSRACI